MQILCQQDVLESSASLCYISATQKFIDFDLSKKKIIDIWWLLKIGVLNFYRHMLGLNIYIFDK